MKWGYILLVVGLVVLTVWVEFGGCNDGSGETKTIKRKIRILKKTAPTLTPTTTTTTTTTPTTITPTFIPPPVKKSHLSSLNTSLFKARNSTQFSQLRSRLGKLAEKKPRKPSDNGHLLIPIPSSQQKPYQPVVLQKGLKDDSVVTSYKLNKMFIPLGIYGKVQGDEEKTEETMTRNMRPADRVSIANTKPDISKISITTDTQESPSLTMETTAVMPPPVRFQSSEEAWKPSIYQNIMSAVPNLIHRINSMSRVSSSGGGENYSTVNKVKAGNVHVSIPGGKLPETGVGGAGGVGGVREQQEQGLEYFRRRPHLRELHWKSYLFPESHSYLRDVFDLSTVNEKELARIWRGISGRYSLAELDGARNEVFGIFAGRASRKSDSPAFSDIMSFFQNVYQQQKVGGVKEISNWQPVSESDLSRHMSDSVSNLGGRSQQQGQFKKQRLEKNKYQQKAQSEYYYPYETEEFFQPIKTKQPAGKSYRPHPQRKEPKNTQKNLYQLYKPAEFVKPTTTPTPVVDIFPMETTSPVQQQQQYGDFSTSLYASLLREIHPTTPTPVVKPPETKFFAPIPIRGGNKLTKERTRYGSNVVPRFVEELARKLKADRDVQGIVRVSRRGAGGKMVEFLYPVRG